MSFVIAKKHSETLETPVFHAGPHDKEEAIAVFTSRSLASRYIADAKWSNQYEVGELEPIQLVRWLVAANDKGTELLVVDPKREDHLEGAQQNVVVLGDPLLDFADSLVALIDTLGRQITPSELAETVHETPDPATPSQLAEAVQEFDDGMK